MLRRGIPATTDHPPEFRARRSTSVTIVRAVLLLAVAVWLGVLLYYARFSGTVRWLLGVAFLAVLAALAWEQILRRTAEPHPLVAPVGEAVNRSGELAGFAAAVRRASSGFTYSQVLVTSRARSAFAEHARLSLGLSSEAMREAQRDRAALRDLLGDDVLADFVYLRAADLEDRYRWVLRARGRGGFDPEFGDVLRRMEAWR